MGGNWFKNDYFIGRNTAAASVKFGLLPLTWQKN
jgi:hypothetical protein